MSYNYGAGNYLRVRQTFKRLLTVTLTVTCTAFVVVALFPGMLARIFTPQPSSSPWSAGSCPSSLAACGLRRQLACQTTFMALGQARTSLFWPCCER